MPEPYRGFVPDSHPYGSVTDGDWVCTRCGNTITGCALCAGEPVSIVYSPAPAPASRWRWRSRR